MLGPFALLLHPTALAIYAVVAMLGLIHHDGDRRGYARHAAEIAEAVREKNRALGRSNDATAATLAANEGRRAEQVRVVIETVEVPVPVPTPGPVNMVAGACEGVPAGTLAKLNQIK